MFREFDRVIGLERLVAIHLNDSKAARASRVDRHEHIGKGKIGLEAFRCIMRSRRLAHIPKVLETPKGKEMREDVTNLTTLRRLARPPACLPINRSVESRADSDRACLLSPESRRR